ncbi:MAG: hypothetical protein PSV13_03975 [Lacunisphaera sp.]|nr:hypothetical protein [Lacunisphaera sp.]
MKLQPPQGYSSWLAYAVADIDTRQLLIEHQLGHQPGWPPTVDSAMIRDAAETELRGCFAAAAVFATTPPVTGLPPEHARELLRHLMGSISEAQWAAGWLTNLEFTLWQALKDPTSTHLLPYERAALDYLSQTAGGWWIWFDDDAKPELSGNRFLPWAEWFKLLAPHDAVDPTIHSDGSA